MSRKSFLIVTLLVIAGLTLALTRASAAISLRSADSHAVVEMLPLHANPNPAISGEDKLPGISNYFRGSDPKK